MRTTDFSRAPAIGQGEAIFAGGTNFGSLAAMLRLPRLWFPLVRRMKRSPGYRGHHIWYRFPFTLGTIAFFADRDALLTFARSPEHARIMQWVMEQGNARGGFIRLYDAQPGGYSSGMWRAEPPHVMRHIARFSPIAGEEKGPLVEHAQTTPMT